MYKLAPLSAAIVLALAGQAMADDSTSTQTQQGNKNIAEVKQTQASYASASQSQTGRDHNHMAVQDNSTSDIQQIATGSLNAGYAEQLFENGSQITQLSGGTSTTPSPASRWARTTRPCRCRKATATAR
jgi:hypothetical protein